MLKSYKEYPNTWVKTSLFQPLVNDTDDVLIVDWWKDIAKAPDFDANAGVFSPDDFLNTIAEYDFVFIVFLEVIDGASPTFYESKLEHRTLSDLIKKLNEMPSVNFITFSESSFIGNVIEPSRTFSVPWLAVTYNTIEF